MKPFGVLCLSRCRHGDRVIAPLGIGLHMIDVTTLGRKHSGKLMTGPCCPHATWHDGCEAACLLLTLWHVTPAWCTVRAAA